MIWQSTVLLIVSLAAALAIVLESKWWILDGEVLYSAPFHTADLKTALLDVTNIGQLIMY